VVLLGAVYALVGIVFALPTSHGRFWRLAAWVVSGVAFAIHVGHERFRLRNSFFSAALHAALAAALGAFGLAAGAIIRTILSGSTTSQHQRLLIIALVAWPVIVGVPAFLVSLAASGLLVRLFRGESHMTIPVIGRKPSAFLPIAMSLAALTVVVVHIALYGTARQTDEGAAAHLWQLLMAAQVPIIAWFAMRWLPQSLKYGLGVLALQVIALLGALAPVYLLRW
jgi:hypothetical protein